MARCARAAGRLRGAHIGQDGDAHADETGRERTNRADQESRWPSRGRVFHEEEEQDEDDRRDRADRDDLPAQIGLGAFFDRARDFAHPLIAGRAADDGFDEEESEDESGGGAEHGKSDAEIQNREGKKSHK